MKKADCTVYIDESGDLGAQKGTKWFVLSAVIVNKSDEKEIRKTMQEVRKTLNVQEIHLKNISDYFKRAYIVRELSKCHFVYMNVIFDTDKFDHSKIPSSIVAYNYICKYLLQRASWYLRDSHKVADIVLSQRGTSRDNELIDYINKKLLPYPDNSIDENCFNKVTAKAPSQWELLQLADVCATTMYLKHQINRYGFCIPCFVQMLSDHLYRKFGKLDTYGVKYFTPDMKPGVNELKQYHPCIKKERIFGVTST